MSRKTAQRKELMCATFPSSAHLLYIFGVVKNSMSECVIYYQKDGMKLSTMDASHVSLLEWTVPKEYLVLYECGVDGSFGVNVGHLMTMLKCIDARGKDMAITFSIEEASANQLIISGRDASSDTSSEEDNIFRLNLMDIACEMLHVPERDLKWLTLNSTSFTHDIKNLACIGDTVTIDVRAAADRPGTAQIRCSTAGDIGSAAVRTHCKCEEGFASIKLGAYALRYIATFLQASGLSPELLMAGDGETPIMFAYQLSAEVPAAKFQFYLAPKIDDAEGDKSSDEMEG